MLVRRNLFNTLLVFVNYIRITFLIKYVLQRKCVRLKILCTYYVLGECTYKSSTGMSCNRANYRMRRALHFFSQSIKITTYMVHTFCKQANLLLKERLPSGLLEGGSISEICSDAGRVVFEPESISGDGMME